MLHPLGFFFHIWLLNLGLFCHHDLPTSNLRCLKDNRYEHLSSLYLPDLIHSPGFKCILDAGNFQLCTSNANHTSELQPFILSYLLGIAIWIYDSLGFACLRPSSDIPPNWRLFQSTSSQEAGPLPGKLLVPGTWDDRRLLSLLINKSRQFCLQNIFGSLSFFPSPCPCHHLSISL